MTIDVAQIESFATVQIGADPDNPQYEGDTLEAVFVLAEDFLADGTPVNPAPFATDSGGWSASSTPTQRAANSESCSIS